MPNTIYNKVEIDGETLIDLSQDTVSQASHIVSGYVGHLNDGTQVSGTGGGSSDYSTATVTLVNTSDGIYAQFFVPAAMEGDAEYGLPALMFVDNVWVSDGSSETRTIVLYKGCFLMMRDYGNTTLSGAAAFALGGDVILVTGDCTITVNLD